MLSAIRTIVLWLLAIIFVIAGVTHFTILHQDFAQIVSPVFLYKDGIVLFTGLLEILGGIGLIVPQTSRWVSPSFST